MGEIVIQTPLNQISKLEIDLSSKSSGLYYVKVFDKELNDFSVHKIIKE